MSCQSLTPARAFTDDKELAHCASIHRTVRFSSESRSSTRGHDSDSKRETPGSMSLMTLSVTPATSSGGYATAMSQSAPPTAATFDLDDLSAPELPSCRFPKLEECAHFHYERVSLGGLRIETVPRDESEQCTTHTGESVLSEGWICLLVRSHVNEPSSEGRETRSLSASWTEASDVREWTLTRSAHNFIRLDDTLHRCIYDRKVSGLPNLSETINAGLIADRARYTSLISDYVHHLSIIADDSINCGPALNWLQIDNKGHKLLVASEDCHSINTPAVAAAYSVRKYVSQARDEISFDVGDMISIIDMPGPQESIWWRGKRGFRVGFFPHHCVAVIGDKVPRHMTQPPPIVGSVAVAPIKPVLRKHGKLISLFRSFILSRPSRRSLKQMGILRERVFGCDLGEHLLNCGHEVPLVLVECARVIEERGAVDGIYRLSGGSGLTQRLRAAFDEGRAPDLTCAHVARDPHATASLLKMYFRELPNPLCTYQLYEHFVSSVQAGPDESVRLQRMRETVVKLPPPHYRTLAYLMRHLRRVSLLGESTGMTARNMAIVWAPNLLRSPVAQHALQGVAVQAVVTEFLICYAEDLFSLEQGADCSGDSSDDQKDEFEVELRGMEAGRRPKSLPLGHRAKLLSLEEARQRGKSSVPTITSPCLPPPSGAIAAAAGVQLRPSGHLRPKYIEVGSGPDNLPQYHTVLDLPLPGTKRGLKRSPSGWRGLFSRSNKQQRQRVSRAQAVSITPPQPIVDDMPMPSTGLRPVKSCESLQSESDTLAPLAERANAPLKQHTRSASCDSYFEPWQAELADMRLRLSPQERDHNIFSEEDDTVNAIYGVTGQVESLASTPIASALCSIEPSPRKNLRVDGLAANDSSVERRVNAIEEQLSSIGYIDGGESPRCKPSAEKRHSDGRTNSPQHSDIAKRVCKDRESPVASLTDFQTSLLNVKLRERNSPRKAKNSNRYSNVHHPASSTSHELSPDSKPRLSWHGKDGHSTLIQIHWPPDHSTGNLTTSTINSSPITPVTPAYDPLESDSEVSETNTKHTIKITERSCDSCAEEKCLKCELNATDFDDVKPELKEVAETNLHDSLEPSPAASTNVSYQNLNRLSAVSTSSNSEHTDKKNVKSAMTSSHESSSSYSNISPSKPDELYECYGFTRPSYINLHSSSTSKSSPTSPLKSPLKSTISITFRSPTKSSKTPEYELIENVDTPTNAERDSVYEDIDLEKNLSIVEDAPVPETDASLPTQQACQPEDYESDLIILETPIESGKHDENIDVYSQVKFFKKSIEEVNAMILESPEKEETVEARHYENVSFPAENDYENINVDALKICDKDAKCNDDSEAADDANAAETVEKENGNVIKSKVQKNLNVRELAIRFESPTEQKGPFVFEKFKAEVKYPSLERKVEDKVEIRQKKDVTVKIPPPISPKTYKLSKNSVNARSLDENAFTQEFGSETDRRKSFDVRDVKKQNKFLPDLNLNLEEPSKPDEAITPTSENKISLVQRFEKPDIKNLIGFDAEKKLSRERIEKYKEERRNFLREKYSSQSFRNSNPDQLTRLKIKKDEPEHDSTIDRLVDDTPKFERRNTVDLGQRMRFSLAKSTHNLDSIRSPTTPEKSIVSPVHDERFDSAKRSSRDVERKEKVSPSYNIRDMAAIFEQKSQNNASNG